MDRAPLVAALEEVLGQGVVGLASSRGGDVADAYRVELDDGSFVLAKTHARPPAGFFTTEATGLTWLREAEALPVPEVLAASDGPVAFLVLEWIDQGRPTATTEADLGRGLAALHRAGHPCFGRTDERTTGSLALPNTPSDTWADFYASCRLLPLAHIAHDRGSLPESDVAALERVAGRLDVLGGPPEPPALCHGDLWAGNRLVDLEGRSWLIDPAVQGTHREFDLAMMRLFGGFGADCFATYDEALPLADGWQQRVPLHQLAPLVVHAIKFGGGYAGQVRRALSALG